MKIFVSFGTRPEAIKMCPLILELKRHPSFDVVVCTTGQHKELLDQVLTIFGVIPDYKLDIMKEAQSLSHITTNILNLIEPILIDENPDIVLVHGDTTTSFSVALAAFYQKIPVGHVEAGLRTFNKYRPFPEEMNRTIVSRIASYHFAPTERNRSFLNAENVKDNIFVTGNTVIDSFKYTIRDNYIFHDETLNHLDRTKKMIILTAHRRENWGEGLSNIFTAVNRITSRYPDVIFVYPVHPNPIVKNEAIKHFSDNQNVIITSPLDVEDMHNLINLSRFVLTDSGGLQEEAPHLGKPVVVLRESTE